MIDVFKPVDSAIDAPPADGAPDACSYGGQLHVAYRSADGIITDLFWAGGWLKQIINGPESNTGLGFPTGPALAASDPTVAVFGNQLHFIYRDNGGVLWDVFFDGSWHIQPINSKKAIAPGTSPGAYPKAP